MDSIGIVLTGMGMLALVFVVCYGAAQTRLTWRLWRLCRQKPPTRVGTGLLNECTLTLCLLPGIALFTCLGLMWLLMLLAGDLSSLTSIIPLLPLLPGGGGISLVAWVLASWWFAHAVNDRLPVDGKAAILAPVACLALLCATYAASFAWLTVPAIVGHIAIGRSTPAVTVSVAALLLIYLVAAPLANLVLLMVGIFKVGVTPGAHPPAEGSVRPGGQG